MTQVFTSYNTPMNKIEIKAWLDSMDIKNYTINDDLTVDVNGDVYLSFNNLTSIPVQFGKVNGYFSCHNNQLISLAGCPSSVGDGFYCFDNNLLTSLKGCPSSVGGDFCCDGNLENSKEYKRYEIMKKVKQLA